MRRVVAVFGILMLASRPVVALAQNVEKAPPGGDYKKVSELVKLPDFLPGLGTLYVNPSTLPEGPFLAYDHAGKLVSTIYMIPLKGLDTQKALQTSRHPAARSITSAFHTMPAIPAWLIPITTLCSGTYQKRRRSWLRSNPWRH